VGAYAITVQPGDNPDFAVEAVGATLTINPSETPEPTEAQGPTARDGLAYTGGLQELLAEHAQPIEGYAVTYSTDGGTTWPDRVPTGTDAGTYTVRVRYVGDESHMSFEAGELTVTIAPAAPVAPTEAEKPKAMDGVTFDGGEQALVEAPVGVPEGHTVEYSTDGGQTWSKDVPTGKNAGTYDVKVRYAANDDKHENFEGDTLTATIDRAALELADEQRPTAKTGLAYTGERQELVNASEKGLPEGSVRMLYAVGPDGTTAPTEEWGTAVPTATEPGTYHVWYLAEGDDNHTGTEPAVLSVRIAAPVVSYHHEAGDTVWTMGSDQGWALTFKRSFDDKTTIDHLEGVAVDGKELKGDADYTVQSGSVIVTLQPAYLKTSPRVRIPWRCASTMRNRCLSTLP
jgi:hypothetical protein